MIQRIQTVYLFLVFGLMASMLFMPIALVKIVDGTVVFSWNLYAEAALSAIISLSAIFMYKKRFVQIQLCWTSLIIMLLGYLSILCDFWLPSMNEPIEITFQVGFVIPAFAIILSILAIQAIRKDEKLVRSTDRLR